MNEPRIYKHAAWNWLGAAVLVVLFFAGSFGMALNRNFIFIIYFAALMTPLIAFTVFSLAAKTIISEDEISTQNLFGVKTLRWNEIQRVSGSGFSIKMHNLDGDVTVAPSPQIPGYEEVLEIIGAKCPHLFNPRDYGELPRNWGNLIPLVIISFMVVGFGVFIYIESSEFIFPLVFAFVIGLVVLGLAFLSPQSVSIQGDAITIVYLFSQQTLRADEIQSVSLGYIQMRNGKNYYVQVTKKRGGDIRIANVKPSLPIAYHVLKNWHKKATA
jgi:hypothetical protein